MINRHQLLSKITQSFQVTNIVCLLGPRQCGKTTLAREYLTQLGIDRKNANYFDLERPADLQALENPDLILPDLKGLIIIDEVQRKADLFPYLRYLYDENLEQQFLILGSASREIINQSSESLAGRITFIEVTPFSILEVAEYKHLWLKGGYPKSYLLDNENSTLWRENYMRTYVEHDLAMFGFGFQPHTLQRLWFMLAHYHGQIINYSELATTLSISQPTVKKYISYLTDSFMLRTLKPWYENIGKRQVKSPKIYFRDSGLLHYSLGIHSYTDILKHPKSGASFEGFAIEEVIKHLHISAESCYFWATHNQAEIDLLILKNGKKYGFEFKVSDAPKLPPSMQTALKELQLNSITIIYPGNKAYNLSSKIRVLPISAISTLALE